MEIRDNNDLKIIAGLAITPIELETFLSETQGEDINLQECINIIKDYEIKDQNVLKKVECLYLR